MSGFWCFRLSGKARIAVPLLLILLVASFSEAAYAGHARPKGASPTTDKLVPAFDGCSAPDAMHEPPMTLPSCGEPPYPRQTSDFLTASSPDRPAPYNSSADFTGAVVQKVTCQTPGTSTETGEIPPCGMPDDHQDLRITVTTTGVRCFARPTIPSTGCGGGAGSPYSGQVLLQKSMRITDHHNKRNVNPPGADCNDTTPHATCPGTALDFFMNWGVQCTSGACNVTTSADLLVADFIREARRTVIAESQVTLRDAGATGTLPAITASCPPGCGEASGSTIFAVEGLFAP
jgi:hypothetical protein